MHAKEKPVISIKDLVVGFGDQTVLDHLSLDVRKGEILGVVGKSGGGKSVLLRTIIGLLPKRHGRIEVLGTDLDTATEQQRRALERRWGVLFQQGALFSSLTVRQNVQFPMRENLDISHRLMDEMALAKLDMVGLTPVDAEKYPAELSGGMTKRAALARGYRAFDGYSPDRHAILGRVDGIDGLYVATAFSGSGFKIAPAVGACMAELITEGRAKTVDIDAFGLRRFAEGRSLDGPYPYATRPDHVDPAAAARA